VLTALSGTPRRTQDFEKAGSLRDREMELKAQISAITGAAKEESAAEVPSQVYHSIICLVSLTERTTKGLTSLLSIYWPLFAGILP